MNVYRQGDVIIFPLADDFDPDKKNSKVVAEGEVTGHAHRLSKGAVATAAITAGFVKAAKQFKLNQQAAEDKQKKLVLIKVLSDFAELTHEEHETVRLPKGQYAALIQREYDWKSKISRRVTD